MYVESIPTSGNTIPTENSVYSQRYRCMEIACPHVRSKRAITLMFSRHCHNMTETTLSSIIRVKKTLHVSKAHKGKTSLLNISPKIKATKGDNKWSAFIRKGRLSFSSFTACSLKHLYTGGLYIIF